MKTKQFTTASTIETIPLEEVIINMGETKSEVKFIEEQINFSESLQIEDSNLMQSFSSEAKKTINTLQGETQEAGILMRIGNVPIVRNLEALLKASNQVIPPEIRVLFKTSTIYLIVHGIGAIRVKGRAKVDELQYHAEVIEPDANVTTIDLLPNTRFRTVFQSNIAFSGSMLASGSFGAEIPEVLQNSLTSKFVSLGGDMQLELSSNANFIGKFIFSVKFPVTQSLGVTSNKCSWVLNPDEEKTPLLGDQLLVQTIAVPKRTSSITYQVHGVVKVDRGFFYRQQTKSTNVYTMNVNLD